MSAQVSKPPNTLLTDGKRPTMPVWVTFGALGWLKVTCRCGFEHRSRTWTTAANAAHRHARRIHQPNAEIVT